MCYFAAAQQIITAKLAVFFQKFWKTVHTLRVNETKVTFTDNIFALESEKESKTYQMILFEEYSWILVLAVYPYTANVTYKYFSGFFKF